MDIVRRKILIPALCLFLLCGALAGCRSSEAAEAERLIAALSADAPDADAVARAREAYEALPEEEQEALENAALLEQAGDGTEMLVQVVEPFDGGEVRKTTIRGGLAVKNETAYHCSGY